MNDMGEFTSMLERLEQNPKSRSQGIRTSQQSVPITRHKKKNILKYQQQEAAALVSAFMLQS